MRLAVLIILLSVAAPAAAQDQDHEHHMPMAPGWQWSVETSVFFGYNYQYRKFTDFDEVESQNWLMTALQKSFGASDLQLIAMFSLEPFTTSRASPLPCVMAHGPLPRSHANTWGQAPAGQ